VPKISEIDRQASTGIPVATRLFGYDTYGYLASSTDWNGNRTTYSNNSHGLPKAINEAVDSTVARSTLIVYEPAPWTRLPMTITTAGLTIGFTYNTTTGERLTKKLTDTTKTTVPYSTNGQTRTWTYTWSNHLIASVQSPRTDVTAKTNFSYSPSGALTKITDTLTHATNITSYSAGGYPRTIVDPNGVTTTNSYDGRMRRLSSSVATGAGTMTTSWAYYDTTSDGDILATQPDGSTLFYLFDTAGRLDAVADNYDNQLVLYLDAYGDVIGRILTTSTTGMFWRNATFDDLGRKLQDTSRTTGQSIVFTYDSNSNSLTTTDPLGHTTTRLFDALNRPSKSTDANTGVTTMTYDAHDRPLTITDPIGGVTSYVYDGFGDIIQQTSPDSGTTIYHYDGDRNLTSKTDAASVVMNQSFDALDRPLTTTYPADSTLNVSRTYDQTGHGFGIGMLTSLTDAAGSLSRSYDERHNMPNETRTSASTNYTTTYTYDKASRPATMTYPSGALVTYTRDAIGRITSVATKAPTYSSVTLASVITYEPFGPVTAIKAFNGDSEAFSFDYDYRMTSLVTTATNGKQHLAYTYDYADNLKTLTDSVCTACSETNGYDVLNRLTSSSSWYGSYAYTLDKNGNFLTNNENNYPATYNYTAHTNRISSIVQGGTTYPVSYTATGNISGFTRIPGEATALTYNKANRIATSTFGSQAATYAYNAFGQRFSKTDSGTPATLYFYDLSGNLIEEIDNHVSNDYIWLDDRPIGTLAPSTNTLAFIHGDRFGSPAVATDKNALVSWNISYLPNGGTSGVSSQPGAAAITQNLRLPGQIIDPETLMNHNGFRDLSPSLGRYIESDPFGLGGGTDTYGYAAANPIMRIDPRGTSPNNVQIENTFDPSRWCFDGTVDDQNDTLTFIAGNQIAIEASSVSGPLPTNQFFFTATARPLNADGTPQSVLADPDWFKGIEYSSGFTGGSTPNRFVIQTNPIPDQLAQWKISIPPQEETNDNANYNTLQIYTHKPCSCKLQP